MSGLRTIERQLLDAHRKNWPKDLDIKYTIQQTDGVCSIKIEPPMLKG